MALLIDLLAVEAQVCSSVCGFLFLVLLPSVLLTQDSSNEIVHFSWVPQL